MASGCIDLYRRRWNTIAARIGSVSYQHLDILIEVLCEEPHNVERKDSHDLSRWYRAIIESIEKQITSLTRYIDENKTDRKLDEQRKKLTELECTLSLLGNERLLYKYIEKSKKDLCSAGNYKKIIKITKIIILRFCREEYRHSIPSIRPAREQLYSKMEEVARKDLTREDYNKILDGYLDFDTDLQNRLMTKLRGIKDLPKKEKVLEYFREFKPVLLYEDISKQNEDPLLEYYGISTPEIQIQLKECWLALFPEHKAAITLLGPSSLSDDRLTPREREKIFTDEEYCEEKYKVKLATMKKRYIEALKQLRNCMNL